MALGRRNLHFQVSIIIILIINMNSIALDSLYDVFCTWSTEIVLKLPMKIDVERYYNISASIFRGYVQK